MRYYLFIFLLTFTLHSNAGIESLLPQPHMICPNNQRFYLDYVTMSPTFLDDQWRTFFNENHVNHFDNTQKKIEITIVDSFPNIPLNQDEAYILVVTDSTIQMQALTKKGVFWALQTLRQLVVEDELNNYIEGCTIVDYPAFRIRGFMQDVGRTYISIAELKREIKKLSEYKINVFS